MKIQLFRLSFILFLACLASCTPQKNLVYFQGVIPSLQSDSTSVLRIYPGDILTINIFTINPEAFPYLSSGTDHPLSDTRSPYEKGFVVSDEGVLKLPLIGNVELKGLTIPQATRLIEGKFNGYIDDPIVTIKKLNFKITVLGEVNHPGTYPILNEKATLPEVLGLAGDLSPFGDRQNLRIIRQENNKTTDMTVDLTNAASLKPGVYYLHPDDIVYVSPVRRKAFQNISPSVTVFTSLLTTAIVVLTFLITTNKN